MENVKRFFSEYYNDLNKSSELIEDDIVKKLDTVTTPKFIEKHKRTLDKEITIQELEAANNRLKLDFRVIWTDPRILQMLMPYLQELFKCCLEEGEIPGT